MELLEREPFLAELDRLLAEAAAGHGRLVFVGGEAGVGKTAFVRRAADAVRRKGEWAMPRHIVERTFPDGLRIPMTGEGAVACLDVVGRNADLGVTWIHSYVSDDKRKTYCVYDGPDPESIRKAAQRNGLPVDHIAKVSVLDPSSTSRGRAGSGFDRLHVEV